jgi:hypothetical protein
MGRAVYLDGRKTGIKVSVRVGPFEDSVQVILLSDGNIKAEPGEAESVMREWKFHEASQAAELLATTKSWNSSSLGLKIAVKPDDNDAMMRVSLRDSSNQVASRDLSKDSAAELVSALRQAANAVKDQLAGFDDDD